jgi:SRSO17 transposase
MMTARRIKEVLEQLSDYMEEFSGEFGRSERRHWCGKYSEGLLREGGRKSIEPMTRREGGDEQALQQFVNQSPWDHGRGRSPSGPAGV